MCPHVSLVFPLIWFGIYVIWSLHQGYTESYLCVGIGAFTGLIWMYGFYTGFKGSNPSIFASAIGTLRDPAFPVVVSLSGVLFMMGW